MSLAVPPQFKSEPSAAHKRGGYISQLSGQIPLEGGWDTSVSTLASSSQTVGSLLR
jgi:hypothetical protein